MHQRAIEIAVGIFMILGFLALAFLAIQVSGLSVDSQRDTYKLYAQFDDVGGLSVRGKVSMAGVTIGKVSGVRLDKQTYSAEVEMAIYAEYDNLSTDSIAAIETSGLLGEKYISINVGAEPDNLKDGDIIFDTQSAINLEKIISAFASGQADF